MLTEEARQKTEEFVARRNILSEQKIKQAEADAIGAVRAAAVDLAIAAAEKVIADKADARSEEHTSELPSLMRNSYAVFCLNKKKNNKRHKKKNRDRTNSA